MGASLLGLSLRRAMSVAPGFRPEHVITGKFNLTWNGYPEMKTFHKFFDRLFEGTSSLPGVTAVGAVTSIPVIGPAPGDAMTVRGYTPPRGDSGILVHDNLGVAGDYFRAMGIPLVSGRFLGPDDATSDAWTCVVDENFARHYWPGGDALGKQVFTGSDPSPDAKFYTIVGVVGSVKQSGLTEERGRGTVYVPYSRQYFRQYYLVARTTLGPDAVGGALARAVRAADPDVSLDDLSPMDDVISDSLTTRRSPALMAAVFASSALLLAMVGLYGVMAYAVAQRTREFGVRMALGAQNSDVLRLVLGEGLRLGAAGLCAGLGLSLVLMRFMASLLYGVSAYDPAALATVAAVIAAVACAACLLPARRATQVDPMVALRSE
jgi:predicted permease